MDKTKSVVVKKFGGYDVLQVSLFDLPPMNDNTIEVQVQYCGLNFSDLYLRQGLIPRPVPFVLGTECTGVVLKVGSNVIDFKVDDRVICYHYMGGMYREIVRVPKEQCYHLPDNIDFATGASVFVNYLTAYFAVFLTGNLKPAENIFIPSCAGGVGIAATQLAKTVSGVTIFGTTSSSAKASIVKDKGVDIVLSYDGVHEQLDRLCPDGLDLILENQTNTNMERHLKQLGRIVYLGSSNFITSDRLSFTVLLKSWWYNKSLKLLDLFMNNRSISGLHLGILCDKEPNKIRAALEHIFDLIQKGHLCPHVYKIFDFESIIDASKVLANRQNIGKVLLKVSDK